MRRVLRPPVRPFGTYPVGASQASTDIGRAEAVSVCIGVEGVLHIFIDLAIAVVVDPVAYLCDAGPRRGGIVASSAGKPSPSPSTMSSSSPSTVRSGSDAFSAASRRKDHRRGQPERDVPACCHSCRPASTNRGRVLTAQGPCPATLPEIRPCEVNNDRLRCATPSDASRNRIPPRRRDPPATENSVPELRHPPKPRTPSTKLVEPSSIRLAPSVIPP